MSSSQISSITPSASPIYAARGSAAPQALSDQPNSLVLVGAQAIYILIGEGDFAVSPFTIDADLVLGVSPFTTDADLALDPRSLLDAPLLGDAMAAKGLHQLHGRLGRNSHWRCRGNCQRIGYWRRPRKPVVPWRTVRGSVEDVRHVRWIPHA